MKEYDAILWKNWQRTIIDIISTKPHNRKIHWFYETEGNVGKSFLCKYIALTNQGVVIATGKRGDVFNQINDLMLKKKKSQK